MDSNQLSLYTFSLAGLISILAGGILSAFSARKASWLSSWASAYVVLIVGLFQFVIGFSLHYFIKESTNILIAVTFALFNIGNIGVIAGTALKSSGENYRRLVDDGITLIIASMVFLLLMVRNSKLTLQLASFNLVVLLVIVSAVIGLILSRRRKTQN